MAERDTRFGGNLERANVGRQYSRAFPSGPPGVDVRYENYQAPRQVDYTRNIPQQTGTPNFRPPYGAPGQPSFETWQQQIDPYPNINPIGMGGGLGKFWNNLFNRAQGAEEVDETIKGPGFWENMLEWSGDQLSPERQEAKINLNDMFERFPGMNQWRLIQQLDKRGIEYANRGGLMSLRR